MINMRSRFLLPLPIAIFILSIAIIKFVKLMHINHVLGGLIFLQIINM